MNAFFVPAAAIVGIFLLNILKRYSPLFAATAQIALTALVLVSVFGSIKNIFGDVGAMLYETGVNGMGLEVMLKVFGLLLIGGTVSDICRDSGETALANAVELFTRVLSVACVLPTFSAVVKIALEFFSGE